MKKILLFLLSLMLLCSCNFPESNFSSFQSNPFLQEVSVTVSSNTLDIVFFTDTHIGRERNRDDVKRYDDAFYHFLEEGNYPVVISGGDMADDGEVSERVVDFLTQVTKRTDLYLETIGNHDRHPYNYISTDVASTWYHSVFNLDTHSTYAQALIKGVVIDGKNVYTTGRYIIKSDEGESIVSIYILDNSMRCFTSLQLSYLEEALKEDNSLFKVFVAHDNVVSGGRLDQSLFMTGFADEEEVASFMKIVNKYNVSLVLTGHTHKGNYLYGDGSKYTEFNAASYHRTDSVFESTGFWYTVSFDKTSKTIVIKSFDAETAKEKEKWSFQTK